jgi:hypothetical protein
MSVGDLKTDGLKGNNFPWQLKMLQGLQGIINAIIAIPVPVPTPALSKVPVIERISGTTLTISVAVRSISIACPNTSGGPIDVSTDGGINFVQLFPGEVINYDAGTLNNYFAANLFEIDCTLSPGDALITYII